MALRDLIPRGPGTVSGSIIHLANAFDMARARAIEDAWQAYYGDVPPPLAVTRGNPDDNIRAPLAQVIVDTGRAFLFPEGTQFLLSDAAQVGNRDNAQAYLEAVWRANRKDTLLQGLAMNGGVTGHVFTKLVERPGQPLKIVNLDPANVRVETDPDDYTEVVRYIIEWTTVEYQGNEPREPVAIAKRQVIDRDDSGLGWTILDQQSERDRVDWTTTHTEAWSRPWAPIVDWQNLPAPNEFYGIADLEPSVVNVIRNLNFILSNANRVIRFHGHPKTWISGASPEDLSWNPDEMLGLPDGAQIGVLTPNADLTQMLALYDAVMDVLHQVTRTPRIALGDTGSLSPTPGVTLRILYRPLIEKTRDKRTLYGDGLAELNRRILSLGGFGEEGFTEIPWPDPIPKDALSEAQTAVALQAAGVSKSTTLEEMGYDAESEAEAGKADAEAFGSALLDAAAAPPEEVDPGFGL